MKHLIIFLLISLFFSFPVYSEIIYTDLDPDVVLKGSMENHWDQLEIDFDKDGSGEITITHFYPSDDLYYTETSMRYFLTGEILVDGNSKPLALNLGDSIFNEKMNWKEITTNAIHVRENWIGRENKYLGIRFKKNNNWHYCWVCMSIPEDESNCIVKNFAYNSQAECGIKAGETNSSSVLNDRSKNQDADSRILLINKLLIITLNDLTNDFAFLNIYDINGNLILTNQLANEITYKELSGFVKGMYIVTIVRNQKISLHKIIL